MTATLLPQATVPAVETEAAHSLWRTGLKAGVLAAGATTAIAVIASAAGVSFEVEGEAIPLAGYAQMTLLGAVVGVLLAAGLRRWARTPQRTFVRATVVLTALSVVPDLTVGFDAPSAATLIVAHVVAAAIIVPRLAARLRG
ncbi:MAG: DUF6069 family protein [Acidimicrobiales bacterium]